MQNYDLRLLQTILKGKRIDPDKKLEQFAADISFVIFDLKYNVRDGIKICETQPISLSKLSGYDYLMEEDGLVQGMLCDYISKFQCPVWYMEKTVCDPKLKIKFAERGWKNFENFNKLVADDAFIKASSTRVNDPYNLNDYHGIVYVRPTQNISLVELRRKYPGVIVLDAALYSHIRDKHSMDFLLKSSPKLSTLRPVSKIYPKVFSKDLVESIFQDIKSDIFVIKPLNSTKGFGVIIIDKDNLESTLEYLFTKENKSKLLSNPDQTYNYWATDRERSFLVEQFIESDYLKAPQFDNKLYDCTMRVIAILFYHQKKSELDVLAGYWKLPIKSVSEEGTLIEKHKSYAKIPHFLKVDPEIIEKVKQQLQDGFQELYTNCNSNSNEG